MGTSVFWGMLVATALGVFLIPGNYTFIEGVGRKKKMAAAHAARMADLGNETNGHHDGIVEAPPSVVSDEPEDTPGAPKDEKGEIV